MLLRANDTKAGDLFGWVVGGASLVLGLYRCASSVERTQRAGWGA